MESLHVPNHLSDYTAQTVSDGNDASAIELRGLNVQQVVHGAGRIMPLENIEGC